MRYENSGTFAETCSLFHTLKFHLHESCSSDDVLKKLTQSGRHGAKETTAKALKFSHSVELLVDPSPFH